MSDVSDFIESQPQMGESAPVRSGNPPSMRPDWIRSVNDDSFVDDYEVKLPTKIKLSEPEQSTEGQRSEISEPDVIQSLNIDKHERMNRVARMLDEYSHPQTESEKNEREWFQRMYGLVDKYSSGLNPTLNEEDKMKIEAYLAFGQMGEGNRSALEKAYGEHLPRRQPNLPNYTEKMSERALDKSTKSVIVAATGRPTFEWDKDAPPSEKF
jgi:hypothetical protein